MQIFLDNIEIECQAESGVSDALDALRGEAETRARVIVDVFLDDVRLDDEQLAEAIGANVKGALLRCVTANPLALVQETFAQVTEALDQLAQMQSEVADRMQAGEAKEALELLQEILHVWDQIQFGVQNGASLVGIDLDQVAAAEPVAEKAINALAERLGQVKGFVQTNDWVGLSDCIGYEMGPVTELWRDLIDLLATQVKVMKDQENEPGGGT